MAIVVNCPSCDRKLRVPDEMLGKKVKCPKCGDAFTASGDADREPAGEEEPVTKKSSGVRERPSGVGKKPRPPEPEDEPEEEAPPRRRRDAEQEEEAPRRRRTADEEDDETYRPARWSGSGRRGAPHRGGLVLAMGIVSIVLALISTVGGCCCSGFLGPFGVFGPVGGGLIGLPLGIVAWVLGQKDLRRIDSGEMDRAGRGTTLGGWICGIVGTVLNALMLVLSIISIVVGAAFLAAIFSSVPQTPTRPGPRPGPNPRFEQRTVPLGLNGYHPGVRLAR